MSGHWAWVSLLVMMVMLLCWNIEGLAQLEDGVARKGLIRGAANADPFHILNW